MDNLHTIIKAVDSLRDTAIRILVDLVSKPSVNPAFGGEGEYDKAEYLLGLIRNWGFDEVKVINVPDERAKKGVRPNIIAIIKGRTSDKFWILSHLDVVPPGDLSAWTITKPFEPRLVDDRLYGRGAEDNGQGIVSSLIAAKALLDHGVKPSRTIALAFVSDEEAGSNYGLKYIIKNYPEIFGKNDVALVPDAGSSKGDFIEVAEKGILWVKLRIKGIQTHGSTPHKGLNPHRIAAELIQLVDKLVKEKYGEINKLFDPPYTTCEPTMTWNPSSSPNIIPGTHEVVFDCRVLPIYNIDSLLSDIRHSFEELKKKYFKKIDEAEYPVLEVEVLNREDPAPMVPVDSPLVKTLVEALKTLRGIEPRIGGIGGGTFAAILRRINIPAVVWSTIDETAHQPNEYCIVKNLVEDAKVMAYLMLNL